MLFVQPIKCKFKALTVYPNWISKEVFAHVMHVLQDIGKCCRIQKIVSCKSKMYGIGEITDTRGQQINIIQTFL